MSVLNSNPFLIASGSPTDPTFPLQRSVRLRSSASAYFNRTLTTPTNNKIWTWSGWVKRGSLSTNQRLFFATGTDNLFFTSSDTLAFYINAATSGSLITTQVFRDPSAWYHLVLAVDTTQATSTNRLKLYVNGSQITAFGTASYPTQNYNTFINSAVSHAIGAYGVPATQDYFDGYLTEVNFVDGQALTPASFGGYNAGTNVWEVRKYTGSYGTNGFYLPFTDNSGSTATTIGKDFSGNNNNWTPNNINAIPATTAYSITGYDVIRGGGAFANPTLPASGNGTNAFHFPKTTGTYTLNKTLTATSKIEAYCYTDGSSAASITANGGTAKTAPVGSGFAWQKVNLGVTSLSSITIANSNWTNSDFWLSCFIVDDVVVYGTTTLMVTCDSMLDVPTNTGPTNANFAVLNPIAGAASGSSYTITQANLYAVLVSGASTIEVPATMELPTTGQWYWEVTVVSVNTTYAYPLAIGISNQGGIGTAATFTNNYYYYVSKTGNKFSNGTSTAYGAAFTANDVIGVAFDASAGTLTFYKNNASQGTAYTGLSGTFYPKFSSNDGCTIAVNFGQRPFAGTVPSGFKALNTYNLPEPTIPRGDKYFKQYLYTGNGGGQQIGEIQKPASLFNLDRSLRFRSSATATLTRTPASAGNRQKFTTSFWVKRGTIGGADLFHGNTSNVNGFLGSFRSDHTLYLYDLGAASGGFQIYSAKVFRDPAIWYHIVIAVDTTQATDTNRIKVYINGIQENLATWTLGAGASRYPSLNANFDWNNTSQHRIGYAANNGYLDGYLADVYNIDGYQLDPTSFGAFDGNNYWTPKAYTGTYGTNGFHLEFEDYSNNTATTIGKDTSGQGNNWTPTGIVVSPTTSASNDSMVDVPTLTSESVANFATINPLNGAGTALTISAGNLNYLQGSSLYGQNVCTLPIRSKTYFEITVGSPVGAGRNMYAGVGSSALASAYSTANYFGTDATAWSLAYSNVTAYISNNGVATAQSGTIAGGDIFMYAVDPANGKIWFGRNGTWYSGDPSAGTGASYSNLPAEVFPVVQAYNSGPHSINFGQRPFTHTPPTGFKTLNSFTVAEVLGDVETPDLVWIKSRSASTDHMLFNSVSGVGKYLRTSNTAVETTDVNSLIQFNKNGFLIGNNASINTSAATYVANAWKAGATQQTISVGQYATSPANIPSVASILSANQISGISIVTWTGTGTNNPTIAHGLGAIPAFIIAKDRDTNTTDNNLWVYHKNLSANNYMFMNSTAAQTSGALNGWIGTSPTNTTFTIAAGSTSSNNLNESGDRFIAYCFSEIEGFSKFGTYLSNASPTDGPFVYTGFRPKWVIFKRLTGGTGGWFMYDAARNTYNTLDKYLFAEGIANEQTLAVVDYTSNGFKIRSSNTNINTTANTSYVYIAFAENPFKYALAR